VPLKFVATTEETWIKKVHLTPEILKGILNGSTTEADLEGPLKTIRRSGNLTIRIFNCLRLIEHNGIPSYP
jgi:hypothetical protein